MNQGFGSLFSPNTFGLEWSIIFKKCRTCCKRVNKIRKISRRMSDEPRAENIPCELIDADADADFVSDS